MQPEIKDMASENLIAESSSGRDPDSVLFELAIVYSKAIPLAPNRTRIEEDDRDLRSLKRDEPPDCAIGRLKMELLNKGLLLEDIEGISSEHFLKVS